MILTVFLVAGTLRTVSKLKIRIFLIRSSAHYTPVSYILSFCVSYLSVVISPSLHLLRGKSSEVLRAQVKDHEAYKRHCNVHTSHECLLDEIIQRHQYIYYRQVFHLDRNDHRVKHAHIGITECYSEEYRQQYIIGRCI